MNIFLPNEYGTPFEARRYVINFHHLIKHQLAGESVPLLDTLHYRTMLPVEFCHMLLGKDRLNKQHSELESDLKHAACMLNRDRNIVYPPAVDRCEQILVEYAVLLLDTERCLESCLDTVQALATFYDDDDNGEGFWSLEKTARLDDNAFLTAVVLVERRETHRPILEAARRMIGWNTRVLPKIADNERVYLETAILDMETLLRVQRTHEHLLSSRFPVDDMNSYGAPWSGILLQRAGCPANLQHMEISRRAYKHSELEPATTCGESNRMGIVIRGSYDGIVYHLTLHDGKRRQFQADRYAGLLEVISAEDSLGRIFVDRRLEHQYVNELEHSGNSVFLTDNGGIFLEKADPLITQERYITRLNDLQRVSRRHGWYAGDNRQNSTTSHAKIEINATRHCTLPAVTEDDYERNQLAAQAYVEDFLLWVYCQLNQHGIHLDNVDAVSAADTTTGRNMQQGRG